MLTNDLVPCFVQMFKTDSKTGYEKALLVGVFDKTTTVLSAGRRLSMISDEERREAVEFLRSGKCLYFAEHRKLELDCNRCMKVSTMLFGHYDALCGLDSCGTDAWQRLADLIDRPSENIERPR